MGVRRVKPRPAPEPVTIGPFAFEPVKHTYDVRLPSGQTLGCFVAPEYAQRLADWLLKLPIDWTTAHTGRQDRPGYLTQAQLGMVMMVRDEANRWRPTRR